MNGNLYFLPYGLVCFLLTSFIAFTTQEAFGNDSEYAGYAGQLNFIKNENIQMKKEVLQISPDKLVVDYVFFNSTSKPISAKIAFPMAECDRSDEDWSNGCYPPTDISLQVNSQKLQIAKQRKIWLVKKSKDQKSETKIPLNLSIEWEKQAIDNRCNCQFYHDNPYERKWHEWNNDERCGDCLKICEQVDKSSGSSNCTDWWALRYQEIYIWDYVFPPKQDVHVRHEFQIRWGGANYFNPEDMSHVKLPVAQLKKAGLKEETCSSFFFEYVLTTGANWQGNIKDFELKLNFPKGDRIFFDYPPQKQMKNFNPLRNLNLLRLPASCFD